MTTVAEDGRAVLLPSCHSLAVAGWLDDFIGQGGRAVLLASSTEEYAARRISDERRANETRDQISDFTTAVCKLAQEPVLFAADAELNGVNRLEHLLPPLPTRAQLATISDDDLDTALYSFARSGKELGLGLVLSPVVDEIRGQNPWLHGRIMADDLATIAHLGEAYVQAFQRAGITATAKHFPGHSDLAAHPGIVDIDLRISRDEVDANIAPFQVLVDAGVGAVMVGPVLVEALDRVNPSGYSTIVVNLLRKQLGFRGLIISDDLDLVSTTKGKSLAAVAVASIAAGVELLLIPGGKAVLDCAEALEGAVESGDLDPALLRAAADRVRGLAASGLMRS